MDYPREEFTADERRLLEPHFTNLDLPVFCVVNLPEVVKGALFARYSRYGGTLRRLYLDEFAGEVRGGRAAPRSAPSARSASTSGSSSSSGTTPSRRSAARTWPSSGPRTCSRRSSSAGGWPPTWSSPPATSPTTRACPSGRYRYYRDERLGAALRRGDGAHLRPLFGGARRGCASGRRAAIRAATSREAVWKRSIEAKALDAMRGLLPAASLSHVGIFASGQAYEQLVMRLLASPLPEARAFGDMALERAAQGDPELREARRHAGPRRRLDRLPARPARARTSRGGRALRPRRPRGRGAGRRCGSCASTGTRRTCSRPACSRSSDLPEDELRAAVARLEPAERASA